MLMILLFFESFAICCIVRIACFLATYAPPPHALSVTAAASRARARPVSVRVRRHRPVRDLRRPRAAVERFGGGVGARGAVRGHVRARHARTSHCCRVGSSGGTDRGKERQRCKARVSEILCVSQRERGSAASGETVNHRHVFAKTIVPYPKRCQYLFVRSIHQAEPRKKRREGSINIHFAIALALTAPKPLVECKNDMKTKYKQGI